MSITETVISGPFLLAAGLSLAAGVVSFASPCVVPLVPGYLSYLTGMVGSGRTRIVGAAALFVLGFTVVFVAESALVLGLYTSLIANKEVLLRTSGIVAIVMGAVLALPALQRRDWRPGMRRHGGAGERRGRRLWGAPVLGAAFGTGWLACTSPALAGIIALASATEWNGNAWRGLILVVIYCAGLGLPFLALALGFGWAGSALGFFRRHSRGIQLGGAVALIAIGVFMLTGLWGYVLSPLQGTVLPI